jgi:hypothetical protein
MVESPGASRIFAAAGPSRPSEAVCALTSFQLHLIGNDVAADVLVDLLAQAGVGVDEETIGQTEQVEVGLDAPLRVEQESVASVAGDHFFDFVAADGVQQAGAVAAARHDASPRIEIQPGSARGSARRNPRS